MPPALRSADDVLAYVHQTLLAAIPSPRHPWHWPALATALDNRIVVLRDFDAERRTLRWYTDRRSEKMAQLAADPRVVLLFYHGDERRQLRFYGSTQEITTGETRESLWKEVSPKARANYLTAHAPGTIVPAPTGDLPDDWPEQSEDDERRAFAQFCVMQVDVEGADFLQLLADGSALRCGWRSSDARGTFCWKAP